MAKVNIKELRAKIAARQVERKTSKTKKYAKMRAVAAKAPEKLEKHLIGLADKFASMAEGIENLRENLGLVRAAKESPLKVRIAATRNYGKNFRRIAEEAPDKMAQALIEAYNGLNDIAADIEMAAEQMGVSLESTESEFTEEGEIDTEAGDNNKPDFLNEEDSEESEPEEEKEASGSDAWVTDKEEIPVEASGSDNFIMNDKVHGINAPTSEAKKIEASAKKVGGMSRKDFILIADAIREFTMPSDQRQRLATHFAHYLRGSNYNFMEDRFVSYCMGQGGPMGGDYKGQTPESPETLFDIGNDPMPPMRSPKKKFMDRT